MTSPAAARVRPSASARSTSPSTGVAGCRASINTTNTLKYSIGAVHDYRRMRHVLVGLTALAACVLLMPRALAQSASSGKGDVIYVPTPQAVVEAMLDLAAVKSTDVVY